jgi:RNA polymerase sigma-70 factor, ECF subfamily
MNPGLPDAEIVQQVLKGQPQTFRMLVERHLPALFGFFRYLRVPEEMIEDMIQETFLRAFKYLERYDGKRSFTTWLTVIGRNAFITEIQKRGRQTPPPAFEDLISPSHAETVVSRESAREMLKGLDEESRFLVELRVFRDLPFAEISEITGESVASLRVRFHRLLKRLRLAAERVGVHET